MSLRLGETAPDFTADSTEGTINFHEWKGDSWAVLFSHPKDFTPVCTTELGAVAGLKPEFDKRGVKVIGLSVDPLSDHEGWTKDIADVTGNEMNYPLISDTDHAVAEAYQMLPAGVGSTMAEVFTVRSVYVIDPENTIRMTLTYPAATGRNFDELLRVIDSLQLTSKSPVATPADWKQGDDVIVSPGLSDEEATEKFGEFDAKKPYLRITKQPS